jgi:putative proteasome-type protease
MRSNVTVGPPIELLIYRNDDLNGGVYRSFKAEDPELLAIHKRWEQSLRRAVEDLPDIQFAENLVLPFTQGR